MLYDVHLASKRSGLTHAHVPALPGCNWRAATPQQAGERAPAAPPEHLAWLRRHDLPSPSPEEKTLAHLVHQVCRARRRHHIKTRAFTAEHAEGAEDGTAKSPRPRR